MSPRIEVRGQRYDDVEVSQGKRHVARQHADDLVSLIVQANRPTDNIWCTAQLVDPERMTQNDDARSVRPIVGGTEQASRGWRHAEHVERVGGDAHALESTRHRRSAHGRAPRGERRDVDGARALRVVHELREGERRIRSLRANRRDPYELAGVPIREGPEQHGVSHGEHGRDRGDADAETGDNGECEQGDTE